MDGEVGRFKIAGYELHSESASLKTLSMFPTLKGREVYATKGFKEIALLDGTVDESYRHVARKMNRIRHQDDMGTPVTSLRDLSEREGKKIIEQWVATASQTLSGYGWTAAALSTDAMDLRPVAIPLPADTLVDTAALLTATAAAQIPPEYQATVASNPLPYGHSSRVVDISADAVMAKKQKETRPHPGVVRLPQERAPTAKAPRERISDKVATIHHGQQSYAFVATTYAMLFLFVVSFLLKNKLKDTMLCFFVDGEKALHQAILTALRWHPCFFIILDWHHLAKKCAEMLSLSIKGKDLRNHHVAKLKRCLWYGDVQAAIAYLPLPPQIESLGRHSTC